MAVMPKWRKGRTGWSVENMEAENLTQEKEEQTTAIEETSAEVVESAASGETEGSEVQSENVDSVEIEKPEEVAKEEKVVEEDVKVEPQKEVVVSKPEKRKKEKRGIPSGWQVFFSVLLSILLCVSVVGTLSLACIRYFLSGDGLQSFVEKTFQGTVAASFYDVTTEMISEELSIKIGIEINDTEMEEISDMYYDTISDVIAYTATGKGEPLDVAMWVGFIEEHADDIEVQTGISLEDVDYDDLEAGLIEVNDQLTESLDEAKDSLADNRDYQIFSFVVGIALSVKFYFAIGITCIIALLIIIIYNRFAGHSLTCLGINAMVSGALWGIVMGVLAIVKKASGLISAGMESFWGEMLKYGLITAGGLLVLGILFTIIGNAVRRGYERKFYEAKNS
ncbi:MAG: hypothetical protein MJ105_02155 [Lachnospiraceae bacterium]|nr:hypothetical protein [Lachnospiraceae bacterium]